MEQYIPLIKLIVIALLFIVIFILISKNKTTKNKLASYAKRFNQTISIEEETQSIIAAKESKLDEIQQEIDKAIQNKEINLAKIKEEVTNELASKEYRINILSQRKEKIESDTLDLQNNYKDKKTIYDSLLTEIAIFNDEIELIELGFYKPQYSFDTSEEYKGEMARIKTRQKNFISNKTAITCSTEWHLEGSVSKGRTMINRAIKLTARAFNNECEAAISNVKWNNVTRMIERIKSAFHALNKLNESNSILISYSYMNLKLDELRIAYEYKEKKQQEKEEQAEIRRQMREDKMLEQETDEALKEEEKYQKLLDKAKADANKAAGAKLEALQKKIALLGSELEQAHAKSERAKSMAQQTKAGHVYIISNHGSFGENIYKIGMTRRLEPIDRVKELGDASVPFLFDVHAMIYSDDAPALENSLHKEFDFNRVNLVNSRKEFFNVTLDEIETQVKKISPHAKFVVTAEARQYKESQIIRAQRNELQAIKQQVVSFPDSI